MPRTTTSDPNQITHGEELIAGLLTRQIDLLNKIRVLLIVMIALPIVGGILTLIALNSTN